MAVKTSGCETKSCAFQLSPEPTLFPTSSFASAPFATPPVESGVHTSVSPPPPRSSSPTSSPPSQSRISTGVVVGAVIGGMVVLSLLAFLYFWLSKKNRKTKNQEADDQNLPPPESPGGQQFYPDASEKYMSPPPNTRKQYSVNHPPRLVAASIRNSSNSSSNYSGSEGLIHTPFPGSSKIFTLEELHIATNGFSPANFLGEGGFGYVHKGVLENGREVAVKSLKLGSLQGEREYQAEIETISRVHHRHLVSLVGYCISGTQRMVVYDFVPNNNLEFHLHGGNGIDEPTTMDWPTRLKIALGSAKGLAYLHEDCHPRIIHRDIKSANILLDFKFEAKVADFGLAKVCSDAYTHVTTRVMGTFGYLAPEYALSGKLTEKSDVYSFGVVLLELISGHRPIGSRHSYMDYSLVEWARPLLENNLVSLVDQRLEKNYDLNEMTRVAACAASCVRHSPHHRPQMSTVARVLEGQVSMADLDKGMILQL